MAVILLGSYGELASDRLYGKKAASDQKWEFFTERGVFYCHLIFPGFLRAIGPGAARLSMG
ncbi:hypothetical protein [Pseudomonas sp. SJZ079]|uniref:hypothetical protein n=1 Tax=Pseudomonas sp. SJZ079 TaxID=2572887 RepID=UPI0021154E6E|nr:hypothetical protein [Pseudomonas sp. SJZ079]